MSHLAAMDKRMRALIRKADPFTPAELKTAELRDGLVATLVQRVSKKREYDDLFASSDSVATWAASHKLSAEETRLLQLMRKHKDIFIPNPILDLILTALFGAECLFVMYDLHNKGLLILFAVLLMLTDSVVARVRKVATEGGRWISQRLFRMGMVDSDPLSGRIQLKKWTDQSWQLFLHVVFAIMEAWILWDEPWYDNPATCWLPHIYSQRGKFRQDLVIFYLAQLAVWVYTCIVHRFFDERRKDYFVLYVHHLVTIMLVAASLSAGYLRIGLIVLWVHDASDILVDTLKMVNYLKLEGRRGWFLSEIAYVSCVIGWIYWRLYQFPFRVIRGSFLEPWQWLAPQPRVNDLYFGLFIVDMPLHLHSNTLLTILFVLHIYWGHLLLMVGYRIVTESAREASRQEYEGDSDDETEDHHHHHHHPAAVLPPPTTNPAVSNGHGHGDQEGGKGHKMPALEEGSANHGEEGVAAGEGGSDSERKRGKRMGKTPRAT